MMLVLLDRRPGHGRGQVGPGRAALRADGLALQTVEVGDRGVGLDHHGLVGLEVGVAEVDLLGPLRRDRDRGRRHVEAALADLQDDGVEPRLHEGHLGDAEAGSDRVDQVDVEALDLARARVRELEGRVGDVAGDRQLARRLEAEVRGRGGRRGRAAGGPVVVAPTTRRGAERQGENQQNRQQPAHRALLVGMTGDTTDGPRAASTDPGPRIRAAGTPTRRSPRPPARRRRGRRPRRRRPRRGRPG